MILYNVTCYVALEIEKKWLEWNNLLLNELSKSENTKSISLLKLNTDTHIEVAVYAIQYNISNHNTLQNFLKNEDQVLKEKITSQFGEALLVFSSQLEIIKEYK